ncbi:thioredoxin family protein [Dyadobacter pollutisoli]|uniref:Thioredoxin family protein n=1 Tax=Dyadobacter pollutisoli TaxID=2910158 RepID=A0A9E8SN78_9BACT|nr:thioredoxin family protein [Dyadobacter pollutisoli]WAC14973.1 thioredoxin family protein [Dyadobacter pollutisoli]
MKTIIASLLTILSTLPLNWKLDFSQAQAEAESTHKMILLNFSGSDWCGPCVKLTKDVFGSAQFTDFAAENLVLVRADFPRQKKNQLDKNQIALNEKLAEQYNKKGIFPLTVLVDPKGKVLKEWEGYQPSVSDFIVDIRSHSGK